MTALAVGAASIRCRPFLCLFALPCGDYVATMVTAMIPTSRHLQYARGYIELGMVDLASDELEAIDWGDRMRPEVLAMRVDLYHAAKNWKLMRDMSKHLAESYPKQSDHWMHWAYALKEMDKVQEAKEVALRGLERHPDEAILHYNLACYLSLVGEFLGAKKHLNLACTCPIQPLCASKRSQSSRNRKHLKRRDGATQFTTRLDVDRVGRIPLVAKQSADIKLLTFL